eukprot:TRINITY_DN15519_c0_g1_i1.p1 TRINITY_DN15519_c0_g1~~TRINITY_DN15519_c0_g1_i1.p1  ORF type:complete len:801 (+),score=157.04 TRINITY_DN15519_c0_g1_i1:215-2617(+)
MAEMQLQDLVGSEQALAQGFTVEKFSLRQKLQALVEGTDWVYSTFWKFVTETNRLVWEAGYFNGLPASSMATLQSPTAVLLWQQERRLAVERKRFAALCTGGIQDQMQLYKLSDDLEGTEWFYLMSSCFSFSPGIGIVGRTMMSGSYEWLERADKALPIVFVRQAMAEGAGIQTVVCVAVPDGVVELATTLMVQDDVALVQTIKDVFSMSGEGRKTGTVSPRSVLPRQRSSLLSHAFQSNCLDSWPQQELPWSPSGSDTLESSPCSSAKVAGQSAVSPISYSPSQSGRVLHFGDEDTIPSAFGPHVTALQQTESTRHPSPPSESPPFQSGQLTQGSMHCRPNVVLPSPKRQRIEPVNSIPEWQAVELQVGTSDSGLLDMTQIEHLQQQPEFSPVSPRRCIPPFQLQTRFFLPDVAEPMNSDGNISQQTMLQYILGDMPNVDVFNCGPSASSSSDLSGNFGGVIHHHEWRDGSDPQNSIASQTPPLSVRGPISPVTRMEEFHKSRITVKEESEAPCLGFCNVDVVTKDMDASVSATSTVSPSHQLLKGNGNEEEVAGQTEAGIAPREAIVPPIPEKRKRGRPKKIMHSSVEYHCQAERQRRIKENEQFETLRGLVPTSPKSTKATLLGDVVEYLLRLHKKLKEAGLSLALENETVKEAPAAPIAPISPNPKNSRGVKRELHSSSSDEEDMSATEKRQGALRIEAHALKGGLVSINLSCRDRPDVLMDVMGAVSKLKLVLQHASVRVDKGQIFKAKMEVQTREDCDPDDLAKMLLCVLEKPGAAAENEARKKARLMQGNLIR